ncbi:MAG: YbaN family protein [Gammaproteobacteria bacterium]|nr:YbaN family protein [Gammaproteobacteria bacterium]
MPEKPARLGYLLLAYTATGLGVAGVFLPILPTTPFLLIAIWAASRGSRKIHDWIYAQPQFARLLNDWQEQGAVPLSAKWLATAMMIASLVSLIALDSDWMILVFMSFFFLCIGGFLWSRPNPNG